MSRNDSLKQRLVACILLLSLILQSCNNSSIPSRDAGKSEKKLDKISPPTYTNSRSQTTDIEQIQFSPTDLRYAARNGNLEEVQQLLANVTDINAADQLGWTVLHHAVANLTDEATVVNIIQLLLDEGADINPIDNNNYTPLDVALDYGREEIKELLIKRKAKRGAGIATVADEEEKEKEDDADQGVIKEKEKRATGERELNSWVNISERANNNDEEAQKLIIDRCLKTSMSPLVRRLIEPLRWENIEKKALDDEKYVFLLLRCINVEELDSLIKRLVNSAETHAKADIPLAKTNLGFMYANGRGVRKDEQTAVKWYQEAANQGCAVAQYNLGVMYANGRGVRKDEQTAVKWYQEAANQGHIVAQYNLGIMYYNGQGVKRNYKQALIYFRQAADQDYEEAKKVLSELDLDTDSESDDDYSWEGYKGESNPPSEEIQQELEELNNKLKSGEHIDYSTYSKFVIPFYRGIHYLPILFKNKNDRKTFRQAEQKANPLYSSSAYKASGLSFVTPFSGLSEEEKDKLKNNAQAIKNALDSLKKSFLTFYHKFHELYSNDHNEFHVMLRDALRKTGDKDSEQVLQAFSNYISFLKRQVENMLEFKFEEASLRNPHVSFSFTPRHPVKYAVGDKRFHDYEGKKADSLKFSYDASGKPKHPYLGKIYVALLTLDNYLDINPYVVLQQHTLGKIKIKNIPSKNILEENEVSFSGYFPENAVIRTIDIRCPRFDQKTYPSSYYDNKHGITEETWKRRKKKLNKRESIDESVYDSIVEHQANLLDKFTKQEANDSGKTLIYPGFDNDFVLFPLSTETAKYYTQIRQGIESINIQGIAPEEVIYVAKKLLDVDNEHVRRVRTFQANIYTKIEDRGSILFSNVLKTNTYLTTLLLHGKSTKRGVEILASALENNTALTYLSLYRSTAVGEAIEYIAEALKKNTALTKLNLANTNINGGEALQNIFKGVLEKNTTLRHINLAFNAKIDEETKKYLNQYSTITWEFQKIWTEY